MHHLHAILLTTLPIDSLICHLCGDQSHEYKNASLNQSKKMKAEPSRLIP